MYSCITRTYALFLTGFLCCFAVLPAKSYAAESVVPKPAVKPDINTQQYVSLDTVPVKRKPSRKTISAILSGYNFSLPRKQAGLYEDIFRLQRAGHMKAADKKIDQLEDGLLKGHILAQRYLHPTAYRSSARELKEWMRQYADHPQADKIYKLAQIKIPNNEQGDLVAPASLSLIRGNLGMGSIRVRPYKSTKKRTDVQQRAVVKLFRQIKNHIHQYEPTQAASLLKADKAVKYLDTVEHDQLKAIIASGYLYANKLDLAAEYSSQALNRSGSLAPYAGWVQGIVQWQRGDFNSAAQAFASAATSTYSSGWMISACAYWASRSHMRAGNITLVSKWLELSASYPRTFYGLIATRALGNELAFDWDMPKLEQKHVTEIESTLRGRRASALIQAGQLGLAEEELKYLDNARSVKRQQALLAYAHHYKLPSLLMRLGNAFSNPNGGMYDAALYPLTPWKPKGGYKIDKALIYAIIRQESRFQYAAQNPSGATGLMQLMPATANYISGNAIYDKSDGQYQLLDPAINLEIGQKYIAHLLNHPAVGQDLLSMAIAYNAGPGKLSRWKRERAHITDPLLFIETIPYNETRAFVERVLSNYWIYRMRLHQETPSLDAVAEGRWARYVSQTHGYDANYASVR